MKFLVGCKPETVPPETGRRIAVIGAGPAGLAAAGRLRCYGHEVHVYDQFPEPGGLLIFGIPEYHVPKKSVREGVREMMNAGVVFHKSTRVVCCENNTPKNGVREVLGKWIKEQVCLEDLIVQFDAVLIATGAWKSRRLNIPGEDLDGVYPALEWLVDFSLVYNGYRDPDEMMPLKGKYLVIGGGLTAVDAVEVPLKYLSDRVEKVYLSYRRTRKYAPMGEKEFTRLETEYKDKFEGLELTIPVRFIGDEKGHVRRAVLQRTRLVETGEGKRPKPAPVEGSEFEIDVDYVLVAIGEKPSPPFEDGCAGLAVESWGALKTDNKHRTTREKVFAAGDVKHGPSLIGPAYKSGLDAAKYINMYLTTGKWDF